MRKILHQFPFIRNLLIAIRHSIWKTGTKRNVKIYLANSDVPKLQLGAGQNLLKGWFNTDYFPRTDIYFVDVTKHFEIPANSFNFIFTEHHIEHIYYKSAVFMLKECLRILKPGGTIRITTPDLENCLKGYIAGESINETNEYIYSGFANAINYIPVDDYCKAHEINDMFMNYEHKFIYDFESMKRILQHAGFINIENCSQKRSVHPELMGIETHSTEFSDQYTLSVEAQKGNG